MALQGHYKRVRIPYIEFMIQSVFVVPYVCNEWCSWSPLPQSCSAGADFSSGKCKEASSYNSQGYNTGAHSLPLWVGSRLETNTQIYSIIAGYKPPAQQFEVFSVTSVGHKYICFYTLNIFSIDRTSYELECTGQAVMHTQAKKKKKKKSMQANSVLHHSFSCLRSEVFCKRSQKLGDDSFEVHDKRHKQRTFAFLKLTVEFDEACRIIPSSTSSGKSSQSCFWLCWYRPKKR